MTRLNPSTGRSASGLRRRKCGPTCVPYYSSGQMRPLPNLERSCTEDGTSPPIQWLRGFEPHWTQVLETILKSLGPPLQHPLPGLSPASITESRTGSNSGRRPAQLWTYRTRWKPRSRRDGKGTSRRECKRPWTWASLLHLGPARHPGLISHPDSRRLGIQRKLTVCPPGSPVSTGRLRKNRKPPGMKFPRIRRSSL